MTVTRRECGSHVERTDHDQDHWPGISEPESSALQLVQQKQDSDRDDNCRTGQIPYGAALAMAAGLCAHSASPLPLHAISQHQDTDADEYQRPKDLPYPEIIKEPEIV